MFDLDDVLNDSECSKVLSEKQEMSGDALELKHKTIHVFNLPDGLCFSCVFGLVTHSKYRKSNDFNLLCNYTYSTVMNMPPDIDFCNKYNKIGSQTLEDMKKVATPIEKHEVRQAGFETKDANQKAENKVEDETSRS